MEAQNIIKVTKNHIDMILEVFSQPREARGKYSLIEEYRLFALKEKTIYHTLNMLKVQGTIFHGNCWCPVDTAEQVKNTIHELMKKKPDIAGCEFVQVKDYPKKPPTRFRTNEFTMPFQEIVNTYGTPRYREINPGLFTIATFPFLFGVMFGDMGHGALLLLAGLYVIFKKDQLKKEGGIWGGLIPVRYLLALMGFFAFYCGFLYNDFMSISFNLFGTCYHPVEGENTLMKDYSCNYPFGIDPSWYGTTNELTFLNSFKMKLSIVLGVVHMIFGNDSTA